VDLALRALRDRGVQHALLDTGSSVRWAARHTVGLGPGVLTPDSTMPLSMVKMDGRKVATSGDYKPSLVQTSSSPHIRPGDRRLAAGVASVTVSRPRYAGRWSVHGLMVMAPTRRWHWPPIAGCGRHVDSEEWHGPQELRGPGIYCIVCRSPATLMDESEPGSTRYAESREQYTRRSGRSEMLLAQLQRSAHPVRPSF